jgi:hypothetical protein
MLEDLLGNPPVGAGRVQFGRLEFFPRGGVAQLVRATVS